jgi:serpin B
LQTLVDGNSAFGLDLYQAIRERGENLFFSPYSISTALAMTYGGARGTTAEQMSQVLHYNLPQDRLHPAFNTLDHQLNHELPGSSEEQQLFQLDVANSLWGQQEHPFKPEFLDLLALNYGAGLRLVDFRGQSEQARQEINQWVSDNTQEKIQDLIPQGGVGPDSRLVLANAIYFKADWLFPFEKESTRDAAFNLLDGSQVQVPTMSFQDPEHLPYMAGEGFQAAELPYLGDETSMLILVPDAGKLADFEASLDVASLESILSEMQPAMLQLLLPKFKFSADYNLKDVMPVMGMPDAFCEGQADFSGMDEEGQLCIGGIFHKAFVAVDEKGTEAAAATAVVMEAMAIMQDESITLVVDRPFLFMIRHKPSGAILFMGRVNNPQS